MTASSSRRESYVHPDDDRMAAFRRVYDAYLVVDDIYPGLAHHFERAGVRRFAELGGGRGPIATILAARGVQTCVVDLDPRMLAEAHRPAIRGDLSALPIAEGAVDGVAAVNCLYFLTDPATAIRESRRVLRRGGLFVASAPSRWNDPELAGIDPNWGTSSSFDSEDGAALVGEIFGDVEVREWRLVAYVLPDRRAIADYLHAFDIPDWEIKASEIPPPLTITKIGADVWARR
jgi:SAM-dependent methyltransferase